MNGFMGNLNTIPSANLIRTPPGLQGFFFSFINNRFQQQAIFEIILSNVRAVFTWV